MNQGSMIDDKIKAFFEILYRETADLDQCLANVGEAVAKVAEKLRICRVEDVITAPPSKLRPEGIHVENMTYDCGQASDAEALVLHYAITEGGTVEQTIWPRGGEPFTQTERELLHFLFQEVYYRYSRNLMQGMLLKVMNTDIDTGAASMGAFMQYGGMLLRSGRLADYYAFFYNIHNFKYVNKIFTYSEGDVVLRKYTRTVMDLIGADGLLARLGGDNYVALIRKERMEEMKETLQNIKIHHSDGMKEREFLFGATMGYSNMVGVDNPRDIMARTSIAYQAARKIGGGNCVEFTPEIQRDLMEKQAVISNFITALERGEFIVYYQPKVNIYDKTICGAEALVRWKRHGELVPPVSFIPILEQEGSICRLDYYVLEQVCYYQAERAKAGKPLVCISVNFSRRHLEEPDLVERIIHTIDRYGVDHRYIEIELTESEDYQNFELMTKIVGGLRAQNIGTSMDDFGTGFSSLNMIKRVDLNVIKIDKSFIPLENDYQGKDKDLIMFYHIVNMVKELGKKTIAEGVETPEQLEYLKEVGCDIVQGYIFDKPLPEEEFNSRLETGYAN